MKKLFVIGVALLAVVVGIFFVDTTPPVPLSASILAATNDENGYRILFFRVTNHTSQPHFFFTYPQAFSNGVWSISDHDRNIFGGSNRVEPRGEKEQIVGTLQQTGLVRLQITYARLPTERQRRIDQFLKKVGLAPRYANIRKEFITARVELSPPR